MLSLRSLKLSSLLSFFFSVQPQWFPFLFLPAHWSIPLYFLIYCGFLLVFFSFQLLFISALLFFIFLILCLKTSHSVHPFFSQVFWSFTIITLNYWVDCLYLLHLVVLLGFCLVSSFETCSSIISFYLTGCFYFYMVGLHFLTLEKWPFVGDILLVPAAHSLGHQSYMPLGYPRVDHMAQSVVAGWLLWVVW